MRRNERFSLMICMESFPTFNAIDRVNQEKYVRYWPVVPHSFEKSRRMKWAEQTMVRGPGWKFFSLLIATTHFSLNARSLGKRWPVEAGHFTTQQVGIVMWFTIYFALTNTYTRAIINIRADTVPISEAPSIGPFVNSEVTTLLFPLVGVGKVLPRSASSFFSLPTSGLVGRTDVLCTLILNLDLTACLYQTISLRQVPILFRFLILT